MQRLRVVLDSNVFSETHFAALAESRFLELVKRGRVVPILSSLVLEETVRAYRGQSTRSRLLSEWLPFILETGAPITQDLHRVWQSELADGRGLTARVFISSRQQADLIVALRALPADGSSLWIAEAAQDWAKGDWALEQRREVAKLSRAELLTGAKDRRLKLTAGVDIEPAMRKIVEDDLAYGIIKRWVASARARELFRKWRGAKDQFPYFTQCVENQVYQLVYSLRDPTAKIDINARPDLDILTHLLRADVLVTNETGFMARAFDDLWRHRGKVRFTSTQFAILLGKM